MVEVAARLMPGARAPFRFHVVGEGHLQPQVRSWSAPGGSRTRCASTRPAATRGLVRGLRPAADDERLRGRAVRDLRGARHGRARGGAGAAGQPRADGRRRRRPDRSRDPDEYASALERLVGDRDCATGSARAARRRMLEDFSLRQMADSHERLYERLLETGTPRERRRARHGRALVPGAAPLPGSPLGGAAARLDRDPVAQPRPLP